MYMRGYVDAFGELLNAVRKADHLEAVKLYGITAALFRDMRDCLGELYPEGKRPVTYQHTMEKLESFMDAFSRAVMPPPSDEKATVDLLGSAQKYLMAATQNWPGKDWV